MLYSDFHVHTNFSSDSTALPQKMIEKAINLGLNQICFTDHYDLDFPSNDDNISNFFDVDNYFNTFNELQLIYNNQIDIKIGIELGLQPHLQKNFINLLDKYPFDFIIGSSHVCDRLDPYMGDFFTNRKTFDANYRYFESILENIQSFDGFSIYGHLDYIIRYGSNKKHKFSYYQYTDVIDEILHKLIDIGKGIEVNTSGFRYGLGQPHPHTDIIKRYYELGGEIITIGSDAHKPQDICHNFECIKELLTNIGFKYYTVFSKLQPDFIKL